MLVVLPALTAGGLARNLVSGAEWPSGVGYTQFCPQPPPAGKTWVCGALVLWERVYSAVTGLIN
jgi:hypothetical protein